MGAPNIGKQRDMSQVIPDENIAVIWAARGEEVTRTSRSDFDKAVNEAKKKHETLTAFLSQTKNKRYVW